jgi:ABC-type polysaccharide/polyol phosphate transport system ATPase subunit
MDRVERTVIEVNSVSKIFSKNYKSARVQLKKIFLENFVGCSENTTLRKDEFFALKDVTLSIKHKERVAILGPNGSGKSTLLKMLSGIYMPDSGEIKIEGHVSSILELSTGFKPELSGLENIYLKFAMMGKTKEEVDKIIDEVIAFSELEEFMETPLKHYSSGMKSKLGFAIVTTITPEILILDEVFAAGDDKFRKKSEARIKELYEKTTTLIVTHSMKIVKDVAQRVIILKKGQKVFDGDVEEGIRFYQELMR